MTDASISGGHAVAGIPLDHLPFAMVRYDVANRLVEANAAWRSLTRLPASLTAPGTPRRLVLRALAERGLLGPGDPARAAAAALAPTSLAPTSRAPADPASPRRRHHPDGRCIDVHPHPLPDGGMLVVCHDITACTAARLEADQVATRLYAALEAVPLGLAVLDTTDRLWLHNRQFATLLGLLPPGPAARTPLNDLLAAIAVRATRLAEPDRWARADGKVVRLRNMPLPQGGRMLVADMVADTLAGSGAAPDAPPIGGTLLLTRIQHALRRPVADIASRACALDDECACALDDECARALDDECARALDEECARALDRDQVPLARARDHAHAIAVATSSINDILEAMSDVARIEAGGFDLHEDVLDLGALLRQVLAEAETACAESGLELDGRIPRALPLLRADPRVLGHVLTHLLVNAVRFTPPGGVVRLRASANPDGIVITVADAGPGISPDMQARLFEPFGQFDTPETAAEHGADEDRFHGAGLGLYVCRALILAHGGALTLHSLPGEGTTARLVLPAARLLPPDATPTVPEMLP